MAKVSACPITVAMAAPFTPILKAKIKTAIAFPKTGLTLIAARLWKSLKTSVFSDNSIYVKNRICFVVLPVYQIFNFDVIKGS